MTTTTEARYCPADMRSACMSLRSLTREWERDEFVNVPAGRWEKGSVNASWRFKLIPFN